MLTTRRRLGAIGIAALATALALILAACGGGASASDQDAGAGQPATTTAPGTIAVDLGEGGGSMFLTPAVTSADAGSVTFVVTNSGVVEHEFVVLRTDLAAADLPFDAGTNEAEEEGDGVTPVDEIGSLLPGETKTLTVDLEAGHYVLICNLTGHYQMGMRGDFTTH